MNEDNNTPYTIGYCSTQDINGTDTAISSNSITVPYGGPYGGYVTTGGTSTFGYIPRYYDIDSITGMDFGYNIIIDGKPKKVEYKTLEECKKSFDQEGFDILPLNQNLDVSMWTSLGIIELSTIIPPLYNLFVTLYSDKSDESVKLFTSTESHKTMFHLKTNSSVYLSEFNLVIISLCRKTDRDEVLILADENIPITLAISLHAPNDRIRNVLVPISKNFRIKDVVSAAEYYFKKTKRRVTFEYILIKDMNASVENAKELCRLIGKMPCHINLIPINGTEHIKLYPPEWKEIKRFQDILLKKGKETTVRKQMGDEIQAACGQLKRRYLNSVT